MNGLNKKGVSNQLSVKLKADIDNYCQTAYDSGNSWRLGASKIGEPCSRKLWYGFRWVKQEKFDGRMQRLLNRGNHEEVRFIEWLRGIGCQVWDKDEQGKQFKISGAKGHFGGALDSVIKLPLEYDFNEPLLGEFKTNCTGAGFNKLCSSGVTVSKPLHFAQACIYGYKYNLTHCVYLNLNKNDDDLHVEIVKLDFEEAKRLEAKAEKIIFSQNALEKISENANYQTCTTCNFKTVCHNKQGAEKNCRSCVNASPVENAQWFCSVHGANVPREFVAKGCDNWVDITKAE